MNLRRPSTGSTRSSGKLYGLVTGVSAICLGVGSLALVFLANAPAAQASVPNTRVAVAPAIPRGAAAIGAVASGKVISGDVALVPRNASGLAAYADGVSKRGSLYYGRYLSLGSFNEEFAPTTAMLGAVESDLRSDGLKVGSVSADRLLVGFSGTASKVDAAFHTSLEGYRLSSGRLVYANDSAVELPSSIAPFVQAIVGLNDLAVPQAAPVRSSVTTRETVAAPHQTPPAGAADACAAASAIAADGGGLTANQVAYAYGLDPLYSAGDFGQGETVDILDLFGYSVADITAFDDCYYGTTNGPAVAARDSYTNIDGGASPGDGLGGSVETELDVDTVNAYAPKALVDVYEAPDSDPGFLDAIAAMADSTASIESISYGECEQLVLQEEPGYAQEENYLFEQGAAMGKTVFSSTGDNGDDTCSSDSGQPVAPYLSASDPATQPFVTAVGGTAITAATDPPQQDVWNDGAAGGSGGGGISDIWPAPPWQTSSTVPGFDNASVVSTAESVVDDNFCADTYTNSVCREVPDVSAQASPNTGGFPIVTDGQWSIWGGTSLSSPTWAAITADISSQSSCSGGVGFISPKLYAIASVPAEYAASFDDITVGNNDNFGVGDGVYPATTGYDMASGIGTPKVTGAGGAKGLAYYLCATPAVAPPTIASLSSPALSSDAVSGGTARLTITGSNFESAGTSVVAAVSIGDVTLPAADYSVASDTQINVTAIPNNLLTLEEGQGGAADGTGTYGVSVTATGGATSAPSSASRLILYDSGANTSGTSPFVSGVFPSAGVDAGGNKVTIYGSGFMTTGSSPTANVASVTFGGTPAASFTVTSDNTITATTPSIPSWSNCVSGDDPATGVCQVFVQVTLNGAGSGLTSEGSLSQIPLEFSGQLANATSSEGLYAAPFEFDYEPVPTISTITTLTTPGNYMSEEGGTEATITGTGLGALGFEWLNVGTYLNANSISYSPVAISSTSLTVLFPPEAPTPTPATFPVTVQTYGSPNTAPGATLGGPVPPSATVDVTYAPTPSVSSFSVAGTSYKAGPTSGGSDLTITGAGFDGAELVLFTDTKYGFPATQYVLDVVSNTKIQLVTPAALTGIYTLEVCGVSGCSLPSTASFTYYLPGNPALTSDTPTTGPAGTTITVHGYNLGYIQAVYFGTVKTTDFNQAIFWESGNTSQFTVVVPAGTLGSTVDIRVATIESLATNYDNGKSPVNPAVTFTYADTVPSAPRDVTSRAGSGTAAVTVTWKAPARDGGTRITGYVVTARAKGEKPVSEFESASTTKATFRKLALKVAWTFTVVAKNKVGSGPGATSRPVTLT